MSDVFHFFGLPPELRNAIYGLVLTASAPVEPYGFYGDHVRLNHHLCLPILRTCRQQYNEASATLYANQIEFYDADDLNRFLTDIGSQRRHLRKILVGPRFPKDTYEPISSLLAEAKHLRELTLSHWKSDEIMLRWLIAIRVWVERVHELKGTTDVAFSVLKLRQWTYNPQIYSQRDEEFLPVDALKHTLEEELRTKAKLRSHSKK